MTLKEELKTMRDDLYQIECDYETQDDYNEQAIRVRQRISALLDIYSQIVCDDRVFDNNYLKDYLGD